MEIIIKSIKGDKVKGILDFRSDGIVSFTCWVAVREYYTAVNRLAFKFSHTPTPTALVLKSDAIQRVLREEIGKAITAKIKKDE